MRKVLIAVCVSAGLVSTAWAQGSSPAGAAAPDGRVATAVFAQLPFMQQPRISPDGKRLAMRLAHDGTTYLAWLDLGTPNAKPALIAAAGEYKGIGDRTVVAHRWVGDENVVFTLASRETQEGYRFDVTRLVAYNIKTKALTPLAWEGATAQAADILHVDHDKGEILLERQSNRYGTERWTLPEVVRVNVRSGKFETVVRPNPGVNIGWYADSKGVIRAGAGSDRDTGKFKLFYRSSPNGNFDTVFNKADKDFSGGEIQPSIFLDEPDMAIVVSNKDGFHKAYKANLKTMDLGKPIFESKGYDVGGPVTSFDRSRFGFSSMA